MTPKITPEWKRRITADWKACFPALGRYRPMWLLRRVGPIVQGVHLQGTSDGSTYRPWLHLHCLCEPSDEVSLSVPVVLLSRNGSWSDVSVRQHPEKFAEAAAQLSARSPLAVEGDLRFDDILRTFRDATEEQPWASG